jgi:hypothetical protein
MEGGGKAEATFAAPEAGGVEKSSKYQLVLVNREWRKLLLTIIAA